MRSLVGLMPSTQCSRNVAAPSAEQADRLEHVVDDHRLEDVELEVAVGAGDPTATSLPITCAQTIVMASHWVGLTLPGMIERAGLVLGQSSSPRPQRGPEASQRMSLAIFISARRGS
jgi:hypothetical protein